MRNIERLLGAMARNLEPTATQKKAASASHQYLRGLMDTGCIGNRIFGSYLSGSYARDTAVNPLGDVDIIFLIDESKWATGLLSMRPKPSVVLRSFADAVRYRYDRSSAFTQRRSIRLELSHIHIDCVPAIDIPGSDYIPDGHPKLLHLWPVKLLQAGRSDYDDSGVMAMRAAASLSR